MPREKRTPRIYAYLRCSHEVSAVRGNSKADQIARVRDWVERNRQPGGQLADAVWGEVGYERGVNAPGGLDGEDLYDKATEKESQAKRRQEKWYSAERTDGLFIELGESAFKNDFICRPVGQRLNQVLRRGDVLVFAYFDRSFRSVRDFTQTTTYWMDKGIKRIFFIDMPGVDVSTPYGEVQVTIAAVMAQLQSKLSQSKYKSMVQDVRTRGLRWSYKDRPAYGFKWANKKKTAAIPDEDEIKDAVYVVGLRDKHGYGHGKIANIMDNIERERRNTPRRPFEEENIYWKMHKVLTAYMQAYRHGWVQGEPDPLWVYLYEGRREKYRKRVKMQEFQETEE